MILPDCKQDQSWLTVRTVRKRTLISLTPLIDVVFILLVFFMLASNFQNWHTISLNPIEPSNTSGTSMRGALLVEISPEGIRLSAEPVSLDALASQVQEHLIRQSDIRVLVKPTKGVVLQETVRVLDALTTAGVSNVSLIR